MISGQGYCRLYSTTTSGEIYMSNTLQVDIALGDQAGHKSFDSCTGIA